MWVRTRCPFSSSTRNMALGNGSTTVPSTSIASFLATRRVQLLASGSRRSRSEEGAGACPGAKSRVYGPVLGASTGPRAGRRRSLAAETREGRPEGRPSLRGRGALERALGAEVELRRAGGRGAVDHGLHAVSPRPEQRARREVVHVLAVDHAEQLVVVEGLDARRVVDGPRWSRRELRDLDRRLREVARRRQRRGRLRRERLRVGAC